MDLKKTIAGAAVAGALVLGGAYTAGTAFADTASPAPAASASAAPGAAGSQPTQAGDQQGQQGAQGQQGGQRHGGKGQGGRPQHDAASADETAKATAAVTAKDSAVAVTKVEKDPDGSFDVEGTKDGATVRFEVSADYATVSDAQTGGHGDGRGGPGGSQDTPVTGAEADKVIAAVQAKDATATITEVRKDPDGSYDAIGTKDGAKAMFDVSADLQTITQAQR